MVCSVDTWIVGIVQFRGIETEQDVDLFARPSLGLIDLVILDEGFRKVTHCGKAWIFIDDRRVERGPGVLVEPSAYHFAVFWPFVIGVERGVNADESLSVLLDELHQVCLLSVVKVKFP